MGRLTTVRQTETVPFMPGETYIQLMCDSDCAECCNCESAEYRKLDKAGRILPNIIDKSGEIQFKEADNEND